jgi:hypothetical protein
MQCILKVSKARTVFHVIQLVSYMELNSSTDLWMESNSDNAVARTIALVIFMLTSLDVGLRL